MAIRFIIPQHLQTAYDHAVARVVRRLPKSRFWKSCAKGRRNNHGKITVRHRGGGSKRKYRIIDFKRDKLDMTATVQTLEYDPNRSAHIALVLYEDGTKRYIVAPDGLKVGDQIVSGTSADIKAGNTLALANIPLGTFIHNIELYPGKGASSCAP